MRILLATYNDNKLEELKPLVQPLGIKFISLKMLSKEQGQVFEEVEENGLSFEENSSLKAAGYFEQTQMVTLAEDSGLVVPSLGGEPGIYSARYSEDSEKESDKQKIYNLNNKKLLSRLRGMTDRRAYYICVATLQIKKDLFIQSKGYLHGKIMDVDSYSEGFGYDPIFQLDSGKKLSEISLDEKNAISHRGEAINTLFKTLQKREISLF